MQADGVGRDHRVAFVRNHFAVDEREYTQCGNHLIEAIANKCGRQRLTEFFPRPGKQEQRDRLRCQQRGIGDQRLGRRMKLRGFLDGEREGLPYRQTVMVFGRRVARISSRLASIAAWVDR